MADQAAVIGIGTMGSGIAWLLARSGWQVLVTDADPGRTEAGLERIRERAAAEPGGVDGLVDQVRGVPGIPAAVDGATLVVEAVPEDMEVKRATWPEIAGAASSDAALASNTSSFPIDDLALLLPESARPRFLGLHFFNPADLVPGVEVIPHTGTDAAVVERAIAIMRAVGKQPALVASSPGFIANRLQFALFLEAVACVEEGLATAEDIDTVVRSTFGFRLPAYGPFEIADMAGLDVYADILGVLQEGLGDGFAAPRMLRELVRNGHVGLKSGRGFNDYSPERASAMVAARDRTYRAIDAAINGRDGRSEDA